MAYVVVEFSFQFTLVPCVTEADYVLSEISDRTSVAFPMLTEQPHEKIGYTAVFHKGTEELVAVYKDFRSIL